MHVQLTVLLLPHAAGGPHDAVHEGRGTHEPLPSQMFAPAQGVPPAAFPEAVQLFDGQLIVPVVHGLPVLHDAPAVHEPPVQVPAPSHVPPEQLVPDGALPVVVHTGEPDAHEVVPVVHGFPVMHDPPGTHEDVVQLPEPLHVPPEHAVPDGAFPVAVQTADPEEHVVVPVVHGFPVLHDPPGTHEDVVQLPEPLQVPPEHAVPVGAFPLTPQTAAPEVQLIAPVVHGFPVLQLMPD